MSQPTRKILVIGSGAIGEVHIETFLATGRVGIIASDNRPEVLRRVAAAYGVAADPDWAGALSDPSVIAAVIATPAPLHVAMARRVLDSNRHVLIEKPLSLDLASIPELLAARDRSGKFAAVGYARHCAPGFAEAREFIRSGKFGPVRHVMVNMGKHFPAFRPAYHEVYYNDHATGGGSIQDCLTHMANLVEWILGPTTRLTCDAAHQVLSRVQVEDTVNVIARNGEALVSYALNQFQAPNELRLDFHAAGGSVRLEEDDHWRWGIQAMGHKTWSWQKDVVMTRYAHFAAQAHAFVDGCEGRPNPLCQLEEGVQTLRFNLAAMKSWKEGAPVTIPPADFTVSSL